MNKVEFMLKNVSNIPQKKRIRNSIKPLFFYPFVLSLDPESGKELFFTTKVHNFLRALPLLTRVGLYLMLSFTIVSFIFLITSKIGESYDLKEDKEFNDLMAVLSMSMNVNAILAFIILVYSFIKN